MPVADLIYQARENTTAHRWCTRNKRAEFASGPTRSPGRNMPKNVKYRVSSELANALRFTTRWFNGNELGGVQ